MKDEGVVQHGLEGSLFEQEGRNLWSPGSSPANAGFDLWRACAWYMSREAPAGRSPKNIPAPTATFVSNAVTYAARPAVVRETALESGGTGS